jgi:hypothetical protein
MAAATKTRAAKGKGSKQAAARRGAPGRKSAAEQALRDTLMVAREHQDWSIEKIAAEAGLSVPGARKAIAGKKKAMAAAMPLSQDPMKIVTAVIEGYQSSIVDFEVMAHEYSVKNPSAAVGAKKAANETRERLTELLQAIGHLPHELGTLRWVAEVNVVVEQFVSIIEVFEARIVEMKLPKAKREGVLDAAGDVRRSLEQVTGASRNGNGAE